MKGMLQSTRGGRVSKVTKPRARQIRRPNTSDVVDPALEDHGVDDLVDDVEHHLADDDQVVDQGDQQQQHDPQLHVQPEDHEPKYHHDHHADFDPEAAAAAAAAAAAHHEQQQQQAAAAAVAEQEHQHQQQQQQQLDLTAASILASSVQNPNEHPDLTSTHLDTAGHSTEDFAHQSGYQSVVVESALAKRLAREPGMRLAQQRRPEQALNLGRRSNVEALFAHIAGELAPVPCKNCHKGHGPWNSCVIVDGQMCGSCANCWFNASGARCSFHETRNPQVHGQPVLANDGAFHMPAAVPTSAMSHFNFASLPASADPVVRFTVERAMAEVRGADKKTRHMHMVEAAARQLAFAICQYEDAVNEELDISSQHHQQGPPPAVMDEHEPH
ncbi:uncharacterized protein B0I36DRAFT_344902 [Microdochium trichocladiopsis]|uniref:Uncharacterized protein n=1 Tax=Microdochium trichocladiopsis TaxID=1682393 RepID=A0A9P8YJU7_9PEZI|nr:uncharacterized protein B0I36DRAFT_344902 [Microdochium trichocladiopsis]KAH7041287.1 hypothetical protein B0I36DRAFT_344902 [Microdochium trichocladiopsis]